MNGKPSLVSVGAGLAVLLLLACVIVAALFYGHERDLPVYTLGERPPERGIGVNTLTLPTASGALVVYVSGPDEFVLQPVWPRLARLSRIGQTTDGGLQIYRPAGRKGDDYVFASGDMMPDMVFRKESLSPATLAQLPISELELTLDRGAGLKSRTTRDGNIIGAAVAVLTDNEAQRRQFQPDETTGHSGRVILRSDRLPGLYWLEYLYMDQSGQVYLADRIADKTWLPVGEPLASWAKQ
jgi:hypothetical protein